MDLGVIQGCGRVCAEATVQEILEGFKVRQCAVSCGFILSLIDMPSSIMVSSLPMQT